MTSANFYTQRQVIDMLKIDVNKVMFSYRVPCKNGKNWWYFTGYEVDGETTIPLFIKTQKNIFSYAVFQYNKNSGYTMSIRTSGTKLGCSYMRS